MKAYVFYSGATRKTGEAICEELSKIKNVEASSGDTIPKERVDLVIGWGAKTKKEVKMKTKHSINHPNCIMSNRDKFNFLSIMKNNKIPVASFVSSGKIQNELKSNKTDMKLPLVGRTNYHQGGQGFWLCLTASQEIGRAHV